MNKIKINCPVCGSSKAKNLCINGSPISKDQDDFKIGMTKVSEIQTDVFDRYLNNFSLLRSIL